MDNTSLFPDNAIVVRGGHSSPRIIMKSYYQIARMEWGLSVVCGSGKSLEDLCAQIPHDIVRWTTVAVIRKAGGDVIQLAGRTSNSASLIGLRAFPTTGVDSMEEPADGTLGDSSYGHKPEGDSSGLPTVFADFHNADSLGRVRLNTNGASEDFQSLGIDPHPGLMILLYDGEQLSAKGRVLWDDTEGWVAEIDWSKL